MSTVYVVHAIDTEGPLYESAPETFARIERIFGKISAPHTKDSLLKLQTGKIKLPDESMRPQFDLAFSTKALHFIEDFSQLDQMLDKITSKEFRMSIPDDFGQGWIYSWHCMDHLDYEDNPRRKAVGMHTIFDYYQRRINESQSPDKIHWHFHPSTFFNEGNRSTTNYVYSRNLHKIIARRVIDRSWFPSAHRAGYHTERVDSHLFLEQWIPFDLSNQAMPEEDAKKSGLESGRFGDWRGAPSDWSLYHPSHDHYQIPGHCRRWIARCLNVGTRHHLITQNEVDQAFLLAEKNGKALLCVSNHDFRDMSEDMPYVHGLLTSASKRFNNVKFKYTDSVNGMRSVAYTDSELSQAKPIQLKLELNGNIASVRISQGQPFGPQPFFCFKTKDRRYFYDNLDIVDLGKSWSYTFDLDTIPIESIDTVAVASNDKYGYFDIKKICLTE